jgi:hypothetical protein
MILLVHPVASTLKSANTMLQKTATLSPYDRVTSAWREMRKRVTGNQKTITPRGPVTGPDYVIEASLEDGVGIYRIYRPTAGRDELARRMQELAELMKRKNYSGALIDMRDCRFDTRAAANGLSRESALPYAINPLWRLALLVPAGADAEAPGLFDALLKLHRRAGVQMRKFEDQAQALQWLQKAREGRGARL